MGAGSSAPKLDLTNAQLSVADAQKQLSQQVSIATNSAWGTFRTIGYIAIVLFVLGAIATGIYYLFVFVLHCLFAGQRMKKTKNKSIWEKTQNNNKCTAKKTPHTKKNKNTRYNS